MNDPDLFACVLQLDALDDAVLPRTQGHHAHGLFLELMRRSDQVLAGALHGSLPTKPFTVAPLQDKATRLRPGTSFALRIGLLHKALFQAFARSFFERPTPEVHLGGVRFAIRGVLATPKAHAFAGTASWEGLLTMAKPVSKVSLQFITPTAFTQGDDPQGQSQIGLFPTTETTWGSLLRRWNNLTDTHKLPDDLLKRVTILPARYELRTEMLQFAKNPQLGFTGTCMYELRGAEDDRRLVAALAEAAFYLGVGYKTTQGMGLVKGVGYG